MVLRILLTIMLSMGLLSLFKSSYAQNMDNWAMAYLLPGEYFEKQSSQQKQWQLLWVSGEEDINEEPMRLAMTRSGQFVFTLVYRRGGFCDVQLRELVDGMVMTQPIIQLMIDGQLLTNKTGLTLVRQLRSGTSLKLTTSDQRTLTVSLAGSAQVLEEANAYFSQHPFVVCPSYKD